MEQWPSPSAPTPPTRRRRRRDLLPPPRTSIDTADGGDGGSVLLDALDIYDAAPPRRVAHDMLLHLLRRRRHWDIADDGELVANIRQLEDFANLPIQPLDDGPRGSAGCG